MKEDLLSKVSELPKPTRFSSRRGTGSGVRKDKVLKFDLEHGRSSKSEYWDSCEVDFDTGGLYVEISRYNIVDFEGTYEPTDLRSLITRVNDEFDLEIELYGVKSANVSRYKKDENWTNLWDYLSDLVDDNERLTKAKKIKVNRRALENVGFKHEFFSSLSEHLTADNDAKVFCKVIADMFKLYKDDSSRQFQGILRELKLENLTTDVKPISTTENLEKKYEEIKKKYPIVQIATGEGENYYSNAAFKGFGESDWKIVAEYVEKS